MGTRVKYLLILLMSGLVLQWFVLKYTRLQIGFVLKYVTDRTSLKLPRNCVAATPPQDTEMSPARHYKDAENLTAEQTTCLLDEFYFGSNPIAKVVQNRTTEPHSYKFTILDWTTYLSNPDWKPKVIGNCLITRDKTLAPVSDAIAVTSRKLSSLNALPKDRKPWQRWVWILDENPFHPVIAQPFELRDLRGLFNWTMTYRTDSDVYLPYGYTFKLRRPQIAYPGMGLFDNKDQIAAAVISNCSPYYTHNDRFRYVKELSTHMPVVIYGKCGIPCAGYHGSQITSGCAEIKNFKFYLAFENSNCKEYITEKMFLHGFAAETVPVVMGARKMDYIRLAPPNSFIFAGDFAQPQDLAKYLVTLAGNKTEYMKFHEWRRHYDVKYRLQYYDDLVWTPLCQKLNSVANSPKIQSVSTYQDLASYWSVSRACEASKT